MYWTPLLKKVAISTPRQISIDVARVWFRELDLVTFPLNFVVILYISRLL